MSIAIVHIEHPVVTNCHCEPFVSVILSEAKNLTWLRIKLRDRRILSHPSTTEITTSLALLVMTPPCHCEPRLHRGVAISIPSPLAGRRVGRHPARIYSRWDMGNGRGLGGG